MEAAIQAAAEEAVLAAQARLHLAASLADGSHALREEVFRRAHKRARPAAEAETETAARVAKLAGRAAARDKQLVAYQAQMEVTAAQLKAAVGSRAESAEGPAAALVHRLAAGVLANRGLPCPSQLTREPALQFVWCRWWCWRRRVEGGGGGGGGGGPLVWVREVATGLLLRLPAPPMVTDPDLWSREGPPFARPLPDGLGGLLPAPPRQVWGPRVMEDKWATRLVTDHVWDVRAASRLAASQVWVHCAQTGAQLAEVTVRGYVRRAACHHARGEVYLLAEEGVGTFRLVSVAPGGAGALVQVGQGFAMGASSSLAVCGEALVLGDLDAGVCYVAPSPGHAMQYAPTAEWKRLVVGDAVEQVAAMPGGRHILVKLRTSASVVVHDVGDLTQLGPVLLDVGPGVLVPMTPTKFAVCRAGWAMRMYAVAHAGGGGRLAAAAAAAVSFQSMTVTPAGDVVRTYHRQDGALLAECYRPLWAEAEDGLE